MGGRNAGHGVSLVTSLVGIPSVPQPTLGKTMANLRSGALKCPPARRSLRHSQKSMRNRALTLRGGPMAVPENNPAKSITSIRLVRLLPSI